MSNYTEIPQWFREQHKVKFQNIDLNKIPELAEQDPEVFAYFCKSLYAYDTKVFDCYAHIGQHSACHVDYANECKQANQEQYKALQIELESIGYNLKILNK